jgi:hypothetical protein
MPGVRLGHLQLLFVSEKPGKKCFYIEHYILKKEANAQYGGYQRLHQITAAARINIKQKVLHYK